MDGVALGADAEFLVADPHQWADIATLQFIGTHHLALYVHCLLLAERDVHTQNLCAVEQALGVLLQTKHRRAIDGVVSAHAFKSTTAVMQGVGQNVDLGVAPLDHFAVHPDFAVTV